MEKLPMRANLPIRDLFDLTEESITPPSISPPAEAGYKPAVGDIVKWEAWDTASFIIKAIRPKVLNRPNIDTIRIDGLMRGDKATFYHDSLFSFVRKATAPELVHYDVKIKYKPKAGDLVIGLYTNDDIARIESITDHQCGIASMWMKNIWREPHIFGFTDSMRLATLPELIAAGLIPLSPIRRQVMIGDIIKSTGLSRFHRVINVTDKKFTTVQWCYGKWQPTQADYDQDDIGKDKYFAFATLDECMSKGIPYINRDTPTIPIATNPTAPTIDNRRVVGAKVRLNNRQFAVIKPGTTGGVQRVIEQDKLREATEIATELDVFDGWMTLNECIRHGIPYISRDTPKEHSIWEVLNISSQ